MKIRDVLIGIGISRVLRRRNPTRAQQARRRPIPHPDVSRRKIGQNLLIGGIVGLIIAGILIALILLAGLVLL